MTILQRLQRENATLRQPVAQLETIGGTLHDGLIDYASDIIYRIRLHPSLMFEYINSAIASITGYTCEEFYANPDKMLSILYPPANIGHSLTERANDILLQKPHVSEWQRKDGTIIWTEQYNIPIFDEHGTLVGVEGIIRDISTRMYTQEAYQSLVENSLQALVIFQDQQIVFANLQTAHITGYEPDELDRVTYEQILEIIHPEDRDRVGHYMYARLTGHSVPSHYECRIIHNRSGETLWIEVSITHSKYRGRPAFQMVFVNITGRKKAEMELHTAYEELQTANEQLRKSRDILRAVFDSLSDGLMLMDRKEGLIHEINAPLAHLLGSNPEYLAGKSCPNVCPATFWQSLSNVLSTYAMDDQEQQRIQFYGPDGKNHVLDLSVFCPYDEHSRANIPLDQIVLYVVDMTEKLKVQARLIENERFAANVKLTATLAHELNTPLQTILTILGTFLHLDKNQQARFLDIAYQEVKRIRSIVQSLFELYRPEADNTNHIDINALIERVLLLTSMRLTSTGIRVIQEKQSGIPLFWGRAGDLTQVLLNLIFNAIDAMPSGGTLRICTNLLDQESTTQLLEESPDTTQPQQLHKSYEATRVLVIEVSDTGSGIPHDIHPHIFEPFYTTRSQAPGLGLSVCHQIITEYGGTISVSSDIGKGSTFRISLPNTYGKEN